jgi:hypothetical protein
VIQFILDKLQTEPVVVTGAVTAAVDLAVAFGAPISGGEKGAILGLVAAIGLFVARKAVTPNASVRARKHP